MNVMYVYPVHTVNRPYFFMLVPEYMAMTTHKDMDIQDMITEHAGMAYYHPEYDMFYSKQELLDMHVEVVFMEQPLRATHYAHVFKHGLVYLRNTGMYWEFYNSYFQRWMVYWNKRIKPTLLPHILVEHRKQLENFNRNREDYTF